MAINYDFSLTINIDGSKAPAQNRTGYYSALHLAIDLHGSSKFYHCKAVWCVKLSLKHSCQTGNRNYDSTHSELVKKSPHEARGLLGVSGKAQESHS